MGTPRHSRGAFCLRPSFAKAKFTKSHSREKPRTFRVERREAPGSWATPRGRMLPPAHASGVARATEDPLARTACFGRAAPPGAPPPSRFSAAAVDRRRLRAAFRSCQPASPAGVLTERIDSLCNGKKDGVARIIFPIMDLTPQGTSARFSSDLEEPGHVERLRSPPLSVPGTGP